ncbi:MAG: 2-hydroxychromene-2-carboxylate isomerase [Gammaproteobacteria bacterium]|nr:2-hydroxychromene-2-carboxylate isomerase [Gammaproteobacteria bacterium]
MTKAIDFYFEFYSPYAYLASHRIDDIAEKHGCTVNWRPFMLGATFSITGHGPLTETPLMGEYSLLDMQRSARLFEIPFQMPEEFPKVSLSCARAFYALVDDQPEKAKALAKGIYHEIFGLGNDGTQPEVIARLAKQYGIDAEALLESIQTPEVKQRLKDETGNAIERGVFGAPFFFVDDQPFWGNDRLDQLGRWLETGGW